MAHSRLQDILHHLAHHLPAQGPLDVFIHHNTLHAFQHLPFEQAVVDASRLFHAEPYMTEAAYRRQLTLGRIRTTDLDAVLAAEGVDIRIRRVMLDPGHRSFRPETIRWEIEENGLLDADRALFEYWLARAEARPWTFREEPHHDAVNSLLIKLCGAFLDQGMAYWPMPDREQGFWKAALTVLSQPGAVRGEELASAGRLARQWRGKTAEQAIHVAFEALGVSEEQQEEFLAQELQSLPGWAGLMHQLEQDPALFPHERVPASLLDFVAVRLLLVVVGRDGQEDRPRPRDFEAERMAEAATLMDVTLLTNFDWKNAREEEASAFRRSVLAFDELERRRLWHAAYERRHERQILLPFQQHGAKGAATMPPRLAAQVFFCIDERAESLRRALEEADPEIETFGAAGFFGVPMNYAGLDDARGVSLCPVVMKPKHAIRERPVEGHEEHHGRRRALRKAWARLARESFVSSRTLVRGWLATSVLGVFALFPLAARVLSPRLFAKVAAWLNSWVLPEPRTELVFSRVDETGRQVVSGFLDGFSVAEKVDCVAAVLGPAGLRRGMAPLVVVLGHGSTSLNNPYESAYNCGACGGRQGGPNARLFAVMANQPKVRLGLRDRDIHIPDDTWFIGGYHDTCNDDIELYDLEALPSSHRRDFDRVRASLDEARARNALERTRRFEAAAGSRRPIAGLRHVQERAEHLAEPRPEYGHCTNAVCFIGRRAGMREHGGVGGGAQALEHHGVVIFFRGQNGYIFAHAQAMQQRFVGKHIQMLLMLAMDVGLARVAKQVEQSRAAYLGLRHLGR